MFVSYILFHTNLVKNVFFFLQSNSFSKCTKCICLQRRLEKEKNPVEKQKLYDLRTKHIDRTM